jgi:toxin ParE1/3/4
VLHVIWTDSAIADLRAIGEYVARDSEVYADRVVGQIIDTARLLEQFAELGQVVPEYGDCNVRQRLWRSYRILYQVQPDRVAILAVVHASRDLGSLELGG